MSDDAQDEVRGGETLASFDLQSRFWKRIAPALALLLALSGGATIYSAARTADWIYEEFSARQAEALSATLAKELPDIWPVLLETGEAPRDFSAIAAVLKREMEERGLASLKVYGIAGQVYYSSRNTDFGKREINSSILSAVLEGEPTLNSDKDSGHLVIEAYVPVRNAAGEVAAVFEFYDQADFLTRIRFEAAGLAAIAPTAGFFLVLAALAVLVRRGQREIDERSRELAETRRKLETFVSRAAREAARRSGDVPSERQKLTLFYSDVRDFTGYAERNKPERVVWFLNELIDIHVRAFNRHGGDIDKMIGDAVLARFTGENAPARAVKAAIEIQEEVLRASLPREIGVGIYSGEVVSGAVGPTDRRDFTVIGDGVNTAARLCAAAGAGEIVVDQGTLARVPRALSRQFRAAEKISVKGKKRPLAVRRRPRDAALKDVERG